MLHMLAGLRVNVCKVKSTEMKRMHAVKNSPKANRAVILQNWAFIWLQFYLMHHNFLTLTFDWKDLNVRYINNLKKNKQANKQKQPIFFPLSRWQDDCSVAMSTADRSISKEARGQWAFFFFFLKSFLWLYRAEEAKNKKPEHESHWLGRGGAMRLGGREIT